MVILTLKRVAWFTVTVLALASAWSLPVMLNWRPGERAMFWALVATALAAIWYAWLTYRILRAQHTPVLVGAFENTQTVVRNFGAGAGVNVIITDSHGHKLTRVSDLAPGQSCTVSQAIDWTISGANYLFYQDVYARWYGTRSLGQAIASAANIPVANVFLGRVFNAPPEARRAALVISAVDYWVQLNRSWDPRNWVRRFEFFVKKWLAERRILGLIRAAIVAGRLPNKFTAAQLAEATDIEKTRG